MSKIVVHDGKAHQDDFLAACVCLHKLNTNVFRQPCDEKMLADPDVWVLDQGRSFDPKLHNFDHHQLEQEICAFTMVLDYFYGKDYRIYMPNLQFVEIFDSYGPIRAAEFAGIDQNKLEVVYSPVNNAMMAVFSKINGMVRDPMLSIMGDIGEEICKQIETTEQLLKIVDQAKRMEIEINNHRIHVLDTTECKVPEGFKHDQLPTKIYSKIKDYYPDVILTIDSRQNGFRMVSTNTNTLKFKENEKSYFTHNSGFLVGFQEYKDHEIILKQHVLINKNEK